MSLLLTRHVDQYRIDVLWSLRCAFRPHGLRSRRLEPLADQLAVKIIMLDDQHALHGQLPQ
jgi:hypothetical protein